MCRLIRRPRRQRERDRDQPRRQVRVHMFFRWDSENLEKGFERKLTHSDDDSEIPAIFDKLNGLKPLRRCLPQGHHFAVLCLEIVEDFILSGSEDATIRIWKREKGNSSSHLSVAVIDGHHGPVKCLAAAMEERESGKGLLVYSASIDQTLKVWKVKVCNVDEYDHDEESESTEGEIMGPVLSPLWVQKNS